MLTSFVVHWTVLSTAVSRSGEAVMWRDGPRGARDAESHAGSGQSRGT